VKDVRQTAFIGRVRKALGNPSPHRDPFAPTPTGPSDGILKKIKDRTPEEHKGLLARLAEAAHPINLHVIPLKDAAAVATSMGTLVREKMPEWGTKKRVVVWDHPLIKSLGLPEVLAAQDVPVSRTCPLDGTDDRARGKEMRRRVEDAYIGVTTADFCVVESATLVMKTRPGHARGVSLVPSIHVAVIGMNQLLANLTELYALLKHHPDHREEGLTNCLTFISGPSKTADIEAILVHGAHGPKEVVIYIITG